MECLSVWIANINCNQCYCCVVWGLCKVTKLEKGVYVLGNCNSDEKDIYHNTPFSNRTFFYVYVGDSQLIIKEKWLP